MKRRLLSLTLATTVIAFSGLTSAQAQTKWDLPAAYPANNFHTENLVQFANDVDKATGGKLKITVHANASLFKAPEIKRAVQGGRLKLVKFCSPIFKTNGNCLAQTACHSWPIAMKNHSSSTKFNVLSSRRS